MQTEETAIEAVVHAELNQYVMVCDGTETEAEREYIKGFNRGLILASEAWHGDSSLEKWFPMTAERLKELDRIAVTAVSAEAIAWLAAGKYRTIQRRHDGTYRLTNEALNIWADGDTLENIVNCEAWSQFRDCTERAP